MMYNSSIDILPPEPQPHSELNDDGLPSAKLLPNAMLADGKIVNVLIACEYSGRVREAFKAKGCNAWSCDILPTEIPGQHIQGDVLELIKSNPNFFDVMIGFPPCTYLSSAGLYLCNIETHGEKAIQRILNRNKAIEFFLSLYSAPIKYICLENPLGHISANILKPTQIIHPYYFGERQMKRTALWLKNLPPLQHSAENNLFDVRTHTDKPEPEQIQIRKATGKIKRRYFTDCITNNKLKSGHEKSKLF